MKPAAGISKTVALFAWVWQWASSPALISLLMQSAGRIAIFAYLA